jgi:Arm DNA-binding domain
VGRFVSILAFHVGILDAGERVQKMRLTDDAIRNAKPGTKPVRLFDERGLFLLIAPTGGKWWRFRYRFGGKQNALALGVYPSVGLLDARKGRDEARNLLAQGIDPAKVRRDEKALEEAVHLAAKDASAVKVCVSVGGAVEIWKGRSVMYLTLQEAQAVKVLLHKLTA